MKTTLLAIAALAAGLSLATAAEKMKSPNGGRIIAAVEPHAEFLVTADKKIEVRFLDAAGQVVAPAEQAVTVTMGDRAAPTKLAFARDGDKLVSDKTIPGGKDLPVVVQIKVTPGAKAVTAKFNLNLSKCPTCENPEYACRCDHGAKEKGQHPHDHKDGDDHTH